jgi:hypothetical protein
MTGTAGANRSQTRRQKTVLAQDVQNAISDHICQDATDAP